MKIFKLPKLAESAPDGSFCLGQKETGSGAVYLLYSRMRPGDAPRKVVPAEGAEEIILVVKGNVRVKCARTDFVIGPGEAFYSKECEGLHIENIGSDEAVFVVSGGRAVKTAATGAGKIAPAVEPGPADEAEPPAEKEEPEFIITRDDEP